VRVCVCVLSYLDCVLALYPAAPVCVLVCVCMRVRVCVSVSVCERESVCVYYPIWSALMRVLQCVAVCCSVLQCVAVCCSVQQHLCVCVCARVRVRVCKYKCKCVRESVCVCVLSYLDCAVALYPTAPVYVCVRVSE